MYTITTVQSYIPMCVCTDYDNEDDDGDIFTTATTATATVTTAAASNGLVDKDNVDDKLVEWLSSCDAAQDEILHKVSIK